MILHIILYGIVVAACILISIPFLTQTFLFTFLFVEYSVGSIYNRNDYPPVSIGWYFKNYWVEIWYVLGKYYLLPLKWVNLSIKGNQKSETAILLVHGYCRQQSDWLWFRKQFKKLNCPVFTVNLNQSLGSIQEIAYTSIAPKVAKIQQQTNCKNLILIGHSMGGIVCSYYSEFLDHEALVKRVVTIGSPLHGTKVSLGATGENAKQMHPGSKFLQELCEKMNKQAQKYYQVASRLDELVFPWKSALLENTPSTQQYIMSNIPHLTMLHCELVTLKVNEWLKEDLNTLSQDNKTPAQSLANEA